jgi:diguanylate cyclase (GGDEF)-like protein
LTKPSDFTPERVFEMDAPGPADQPDSGALARHVLLARTLALLLLVTAIGTLAVTVGFPSTNFFISSAVLVAFAAYVFVSESRVRKLTVNLEKRLRLGLLVHNMELENMAMQDDLTQLFNRRYLFERLERELDTAKAFKRPLSVIVVDLNSMKFVNDNYGHRVGDQLLGAFGRFLLDYTRASDVPARTGGDEFAIILPDTSDKSAQVLKARLAKRLEGINLIDSDGLQIKVTASFGVSGYPRGGETVDEIIAAADVDMYADKSAHKGGVTVETHPSANGAAGSSIRLEPQS